MDRQNAGLGAILVAFLGAVFLASASRTGLPPATDTAAASRNSLARAVAKHAFPEHTGVDMIMDFLDADAEQTVLKFPWSSKEPWPTGDSSWPKGDPRGSYKTGYIIATLPDPSEPPLSDRFDSRLEAIQPLLQKTATSSIPSTFHGRIPRPETARDSGWARNSTSKPSKSPAGIPAKPPRRRAPLGMQHPARGGAQWPGEQRGPRFLLVRQRPAFSQLPSQRPLPTLPLHLVQIAPRGTLV